MLNNISLRNAKTFSQLNSTNPASPKEHHFADIFNHFADIFNHFATFCFLPQRTPAAGKTAAVIKITPNITGYNWLIIS